MLLTGVRCKVVIRLQNTYIHQYHVVFTSVCKHGRFTLQSPMLRVHLLSVIHLAIGETSSPWIDTLPIACCIRPVFRNLDINKFYRVF